MAVRIRRVREASVEADVEEAKEDDGRAQGTLKLRAMRVGLMMMSRCKRLLLVAMLGFDVLVNFTGLFTFLVNGQLEVLREDMQRGLWMHDVDLPSTAPQSDTIVATTLFDLPPEFTSVVRVNRERYCAARNCTYVELNDRWNSYRGGGLWASISRFLTRRIRHYAKPFFIRTILYRILQTSENRTRWLFFVDADALITNCSKDSYFLEHEASKIYKADVVERARMFLAGDHNGVNAGMLLFRVNQAALDLLNDWCALSLWVLRYRLSLTWVLPFTDQSMLQALMAGYADWFATAAPVPLISQWTWAHACRRSISTDVQFRRFSEECLDRVLPLPRRSMNGRAATWRAGDFVIHFPGLPFQEKMGLMRERTAELRC